MNEDELFQITQEGARIFKAAIVPFFESANARQELVEAQLEETFKDLQIARMEIDKVEEEKRVLQEKVDIFTQREMNSFERGRHRGRGRKRKRNALNLDCGFY